MKLKASEAVYVIICLIAVATALAGVYISRSVMHHSEMKINLAETDAEQYDVSVINSASAEDFMAIHGIGEVKAKAIVEYRKALGGFKSVARVKDVQGISDAIYLRIIEHFYASNEEAAASASAAVVTSAPITVNEESITEAVGVTSVPETVTAKPHSTKRKTTAETKSKAAEEGSAETEELSEIITEEQLIREVNINSANTEELSQALLIDISLAEEIVCLRERISYFSSTQELYLCSGMTDEIYTRIKQYLRLEE